MTELVATKLVLYLLNKIYGGGGGGGGYGNNFGPPDK